MCIRIKFVLFFIMTSKKESYLERLYYNRKNLTGFRGIQPLIDEAQKRVGFLSGYVYII